MIRHYKIFYIALAVMALAAVRRHAGAVESALATPGLLDAMPSEKIWLVIAAALMGLSFIPFGDRNRDTPAIRVGSVQLVKENLNAVAERIATLVSSSQPDVPGLIDYTMFQAIAAGASDIHFDPVRDGFVVRFRIDGIVSDIARIPAQLTRRITNRLKVLSNLVVYQGFLPQDGRLDKKNTDSDGPNRTTGATSDFRVAFMPTLHGERIVIRILGRGDVGLGFSDIGMSDAEQEMMARFVAQPQGMIILTGPTGSGKTTTIYAALRAIQSQTHAVRAISTLEDPIEYEIPGINQSQVDEKKSFTFEKGLRAILRQDPDVIMVGEIRDTETAGIAIQSGMTGHLIITTVHANSSAATFSRLLEMGVAPFSLNAALTAVISQRLVRAICPHCRVERPIDSVVIDALELRCEPGEFKIFEGSGCEACGGTGYLGRHALFEILEVTEPIRQLVSNGASADGIFDAATAGGMRSLYDSGIDAVKRGVTTADEVIRTVVRNRR